MQPMHQPSADCAVYCTDIQCSLNSNAFSLALAIGYDYQMIMILNWLLQCSIGGRGLGSVVNVVDPIRHKKELNRTA